MTVYNCVTEYSTEQSR